MVENQNLLKNIKVVPSAIYRWDRRYLRLYGILLTHKLAIFKKFHNSSHGNHSNSVGYIRLFWSGTSIKDCVIGANQSIRFKFAGEF